MTEITPSAFDPKPSARVPAKSESTSVPFSSVLNNTTAQWGGAVQASTLFDQTQSLNRKRRVPPIVSDSVELEDDPNALLNGLKKAIKRLINAERHQAGL